MVTVIKRVILILANAENYRKMNETSNFFFR